MSVTFTLDHKINVQNPGWLWYSHDDKNPPRDRQVVSGIQDPFSPNIRMASHYFLTDSALQVLSGVPYHLAFLGNRMWSLCISDKGRAALFKLRFM